MRVNISSSKTSARARRVTCSRRCRCSHPARVVDLGCGPGNSTELLIARYPQAEVIGFDSSPDMLRQARERLPYCTFVEADLATWNAARAGRICCSPTPCFNGCPITPRCCGVCSSGCRRAACWRCRCRTIPTSRRSPSCARWRKTGPWAAEVAVGGSRRATICRNPRPITICCSRSVRHLDIWHTVYNHVMAGPDAHRRMVQGFGACGRFCPCSTRDMRRGFVAEYRATHRPRISRALRRQGPAAVPAAVHRRDALARDVGPHAAAAMTADGCLVYSAARLLAFTRTLVAIGPVSPTSSL